MPLHPTLVLALVTVLTSCPAAAHASGRQLRAWPLVDYQEKVDGWSLDLLGPMLSVTASPAETKVTLRPLASFSRAGDESHLTILYPLLTLTWNQTKTRARLLGFGAIDGNTTPAAEEWRTYVRLPPLLYYRAGPTQPTSIALFPLYADVADFLGQHRMSAIAFPLFARIEPDAGGSIRTWAPFPFLSMTNGPTAHGFGLWPLFGWHSGKRGSSVYGLWPLYIRRTETLANGEIENSVTLGPLYWRSDSPSRSSRGVLGFGYRVDRDRSNERWDFPWPIWHFDRSPDLTRISLRPFYVHSRTSTVSSGSVLWPLYHWQTQLVGDDRYARREVLLRLWRRTSRSKATGELNGLHTLFPVFRYNRRGNSSSLGIPAFLDGVFPTNLQVRELYAPLWQVFTLRRQGEQRRWRLLWGLLADDGERLHYPLEWNFGETSGNGG
jgi:hypothetical protein